MAQEPADPPATASMLALDEIRERWRECSLLDREHAHLRTFVAEMSDEMGIAVSAEDCETDVLIGALSGRTLTEDQIEALDDFFEHHLAGFLAELVAHIEAGDRDGALHLIRHHAPQAFTDAGAHRGRARLLAALGQSSLL